MSRMRRRLREKSSRATTLRAIRTGRPSSPRPPTSDLAAYIDNPAPLDLAGWVQGVSAYPYTARGPRITQQYWQQFTRITGGRAALFAFYFN